MAIRETVTALIAGVQDIGFHRTEAPVLWLTEIRTPAGALEGRSWIAVSQAVAALDLHPRDQIQFHAEVMRNTDPLATGMLADAMNARRTAYHFRRPTRVRLIARA